MVTTVGLGKGKKTQKKKKTKKTKKKGKKKGGHKHMIIVLLAEYMIIDLNIDISQPNTNIDV